MNKTAALFLFLLSAFAVEAQLVEYPLPSATRTKTKRLAARTQALDPTFLPFFDDFSTNDTLLRDSLWLYGQSVLLNNGMGIRPPSKNVVSFDGADSLGKPYNINDVLAKGFADRLTSQPIRMDLVNPADRAMVYFSFFYQLQGRGEPPDPGDQLILSFKAQDGTWENVYVLETNANMATDVFQQVIIPVSEDRFFHDAFQFRFYNYARLSGPYDTWNIDYIYLNKGRNINDTQFPDRTVSSSFTSLFSDYFAMPVRHFLDSIEVNLVKPQVELYNLKEFNIPSGETHVQPINYTTTAKITSRVNGSVSSLLVKLDSAQFPGADLPGLSFLNVTLNKIPGPSDFDINADSIHIRLKYGMSTKDNVLLADSGDYNPALYSPIDFRQNDSLTADYVLSSYYAYDDGAAEYGAGLNQAGTYFAYQFNSRINSVDTLTYVDIYFPEFGDNTNQSLLLQIRSILGDIAAAPLFEQLIVVQRSTMNKFVRYPLYRPVPVGSTFYVGWKQITNASIPVGLDKNTNNAAKMYFNTTGNWVQNVDVQGSLMVRPGFGKGDGNVVTGLETPAKPPVFFPNPSRGTCTLRARADAVEVYDLTGRRASFHWETFGEETTLTFDEASTGLFLVRTLINGRAYTQKIMVLPAGR
ncbi:MAG: T9SS type A sorting domain-containing protein [Cyclobacteriaceae bacterium]|nr:T9SS type A sorting domain-containing protein [Cyclobacteriaceae bacterium]